MAAQPAPVGTNGPVGPYDSPELSAEEREFRARQWQRTQVIRLGNRDVIAHGVKNVIWSDIYHYAMTISWPVFFGAFATLFIALNALFATIYLQGAEPIANQLPGGFWGAFFFSVETLSTVGYGDMHPQTMFGHAVATVEIFVGMSYIALFTGIIFARFSRPRARIVFANNAVVGPLDGVPTLAIRAANARRNVIVDASARLRLLRLEISQEGQTFRKLHDLSLVRDQHPIFTLGWTMMHVIDESSPLHGATAESFLASGASIILTINGVDETTSQTMLSRATYAASEIFWGRAYEDILFTDEFGVDHVDYARFHDTRAL